MSEEIPAAEIPAPATAPPATAPPAAAAAAEPDPHEEACRVLVRLESPDARLKDLLDDLARPGGRGGAENTALARRVQGVLRRRGLLDHYLSCVSHRPLESLSPWVRALLRLGLYLALDEAAPPEALAEASTRVAKRHGHDGAAKFAVGCLRELCRLMAEDKLPPLPSHPLQRLAVESSHPLWMAERLAEDFGFDRAAEVLAATDSAPSLCLRANPLRVQRDELLQRLRSAKVGAEPCAWSPWGLSLAASVDARRLPGFYEGDFHIQDESAQLVVQLLDPQPGWQVADVCAAPGGKASHLAQLVGPQGRVHAFDRKPGALDKLKATLGRQGLAQIDYETRDAMSPKEGLLGSFDAVLLDAPCSALGVLRRRPEARWQARFDGPEAHAGRQLRLLQSSARYLKPGGVLVYSTTTWDRAEDEAVVERFLGSTPGFAFERAQLKLPVQLCTREGYFRAWPGFDRMDGAFAARLRKVA